MVSLVLPVSFSIPFEFLTRMESYSLYLPRSFFVKFSFRVALWAWTRMIVVLSQYLARVYPEDALMFVRPLVYSFLVLMCFDVPHACVQVCAAAAVEDHCLVLSLGIPAVWLSSLLALSLRTPVGCHLAWMIDAVACGLSPSSCTSTLWVDRHSVPWACLPHPLVG